jgi:hypothetical protein
MTAIMPDERDEDKERKKVIHYTVDDEPQETHEKVLTAAQIVRNAGLDPEQRYLLELVPSKDPLSFEGKMDSEIKMREGTRFITAGTGPTPQS